MDTWLSNKENVYSEGNANKSNPEHESMTDLEWRTSLAENFTTTGLIGGNLADMDRYELEAGNWVVERFGGHLALLDSFMGFFLETLDLAQGQIMENGWPRDKPNYAVTFVYFGNLFRSFRACETLLMKGYPLQAYASLRDIKDRAFSIAGIAHNAATFANVIGAIPVQVTDPTYAKQSLRMRKNAEQAISDRLVNKNSGLSSDVQNDLAKWDAFFHREVHGATLSLMEELDGLNKGEVQRIGPTFDFNSYVMYMNRAAEVGWLVVRVLPFLQLTPGAFWPEWERKHAILDDCFRYMVEQLGMLGKKIGPSFIAMVDTNFTFEQPFCYFEANGSPK